MFQVTITAANTISVLTGEIQKHGETTRQIGANVFSKSDIGFIDTNGVTLVTGAMSLTFVAKAFKESEAAWNFVAEDGTKSTLFKGKGLTAQILDLDVAGADDAGDDSGDDEADDEEETPKSKKKPAAKKKSRNDDDDDEDDAGDDSSDDDEEEAPKSKKGGKKVATSDFDWDD